MFDVFADHRFHELDGIRGIASFAVGVSHALQSLAFFPSFALTAMLVYIAKSLINGGAAVDLFFIMSGFFLCGMVENAQGKKLVAFYVRRYLRLAPPAIISVLLAYLYGICVSGHQNIPGASGLILDFFNFTDHPPLHDIVMNLTLLRHEVNPPLWTIRIEIVASAVFPLLFWFKNLRAAAAYRFSIFVLLAFLGYILRDYQKLGLDLFHYLYIFYAGALVRDYGPAFSRISANIQTACFVMAFAILLAAGFLDPAGANHPFIFDFLCCVSGCVIVILTAFGGLYQIKQFLTSMLIQFLGRISYSFYLLNEIILRLVAIIAFEAAPRLHLTQPALLLLILPASLGFTVLGAWLFSITVERPFIALSRSLGARIA